MKQEGVVTEPKIDGLPEVLGFVLTEEMRGIRNQLVEAMKDCGEIQDLLGEYQEWAELYVDSLHYRDYEAARVGHQLDMALIRRDAYRTDEYIEDLYEAVEDLCGMERRDSEFPQFSNPAVMSFSEMLDIILAEIDRVTG